MFAKGKSTSDQTLFPGILTGQAGYVSAKASNLMGILPRCVYGITRNAKDSV